MSESIFMSLIDYEAQEKSQKIVHLFYENKSELLQLLEEGIEDRVVEIYDLHLALESIHEEAINEIFGDIIMRYVYDIDESVYKELKAYALKKYKEIIKEEKDSFEEIEKRLNKKFREIENYYERERKIVYERMREIEKNIEDKSTFYAALNLFEIVALRNFRECRIANLFSAVELYNIAHSDDPSEIAYKIYEQKDKYAMINLDRFLFELSFIKDDIKNLNDVRRAYEYYQEKEYLDALRYDENEEILREISRYF